MEKAEYILSIQSHVVYGHAGNASAVFPLQRMGFEVADIHTVQFSNHTGYGAWKGEILPPALIAQCVEGLQDRDVLKDMRAVLTGYLGAPETALVIADTITKVKAANPNAIYCSDPVMGDFGRDVYVHPEIPSFIQEHILPIADIITPNHFETQLLSAVEITDIPSALKAMEKLQQKGPRTVVLTSFAPGGVEGDTIACIAKQDDDAWIFRAPKVPLDKNPVGTGDAFSALLLAHTLKGKSIDAALQYTAAGLWYILDVSKRCNSWEIQTIKAQDLFVNPENLFSVEKL